MWSMQSQTTHHVKWEERFCCACLNLGVWSYGKWTKDVVTDNVMSPYLISVVLLSIYSLAFLSIYGVRSLSCNVHTLHLITCRI